MILYIRIFWWIENLKVHYLFEVETVCVVNVLHIYVCVCMGSAKLTYSKTKMCKWWGYSRNDLVSFPPVGGRCFHLCVTFFTSATVKCGIHLSPVSDRVDKTPMDDWLNESAWFVSGERHWLHLLSASLRECVCQDVKASISGYCVCICVTFHVARLCVSRLCLSYVIFTCLWCTVRAHLLCACSCFDMVHCSLCAYRYRQHDVIVCIAFLYIRVCFLSAYGTHEGEC